MNLEDNVGVTTCVTCGKQYKICRTCMKRRKVWESWRATACSPECWQVSQVINQRFYNQITPEDACMKLDAIGVDKINLLPDVAEFVANLRKEAGRQAPQTPAKASVQSAPAKDEKDEKPKTETKRFFRHSEEDKD